MRNNVSASFEEAAAMMRTALQFWRAAGFPVLAGNRERDGATVIVLPKVQIEMQPDESFIFSEREKVE
jgi:hypothetical protein